MEILDTSIANVSLPHIAGNLSATTEESTWVLTSYLVSNAIILSAAGWLSRYYGRKRYLAFSVILFTVSSAMCGMAHSLGFLIFARILQGLGGGGLQPLAQAILLESFPPEERGSAMAAYGMGVVVAPIVGPTLGGWITDNYSWRWIFYINIPIGLLGLFMQQMFIEDPPYLKRAKGVIQRIDFVGFGLMALGIGWLQIILDKGQQADWFGAEWIRWSSLVVAALLIGWVLWELWERDPIVNLRLMKNRNFATASTLMAMLGAVLYGSTVLLPIFMQSLLHYTAYRSGLAMTPRGIGSFFSMLIVGRLVKKFDPRAMIFFGFCGIAVSSWMLSRLSMDITPSSISWPLVLNGFSMGFVFVPMTTLSVATLRQDEIYQSSSLYSLMRNTGASIGISVLVALESRLVHTHQAVLSTHVGVGSPALQQRLGALMHAMMARGMTEGAASSAALRTIYGIFMQQATLLSYMDCFRIMALVCLICAPLILLFQKGQGGGDHVMME